MRETDNNSRSIFLSVEGAYVVRTSCLNDKHSWQLFRMGLRDKTTPTSTTPLITANMSCVVATTVSSLAFLSSSVSMANLSRLVAASYCSLALLSSSVSAANLSCLLAITFSSLRILFNSLSSPRFNLLREARHCFSVSSGILFFHYHVLSSAFLFSVLQSLKLCLLLRFSFLSERFFLTHAKAT